MDRILELKNTIQAYAWGSKTAIPQLLGVENPSQQPQAELWMGAHPKAPSLVRIDKQWLPLNRVIDEHPDDILGPAIHQKFGAQLPFLFKVLAAAEPLSLQAHPSLVQARQGYRRENAAGIPLDAPDRNYKDQNHKPECICALTPFWALKGFRSKTEILDLARDLGASGFVQLLDPLTKKTDAEGLKDLFRNLMSIPQKVKQQMTREALQKARPLAGENPVFEWMRILGQAYPGDVGIFSPILLNLICLQPGQAMFLPSGELHAYLEGVGMELMANSDNVLRGGLTPKHVDVAELLDLLSFDPAAVELLAPREVRSLEHLYPTAAEEFVLSVISLQTGLPYRSPARRSVEIVICIEGRAVVVDEKRQNRLWLEKGMSLLIPAAVSQYRIEGAAVVYKAAVPI
jgi:mannose-6-phosphate isomerase